jgi:hypothetical protein
MIACSTGRRPPEGGIGIVEQHIAAPLRKHHLERDLGRGIRTTARARHVAPPSIIQLIELNLERLTPDEQAVLETASLAGIEVPIAAVATASN